MLKILQLGNFNLKSVPYLKYLLNLFQHPFHFYIFSERLCSYKNYIFRASVQGSVKIMKTQYMAIQFVSNFNIKLISTLLTTFPFQKSTAFRFKTSALLVGWCWSCEGKPSYFDLEASRPKMATIYRSNKYKVNGQHSFEGKDFDRVFAIFWQHFSCVLVQCWPILSWVQFLWGK